MSKVLDLGCGKNKIDIEGAIGIDIVGYPDVDVVMDLRMHKLPYPENDIDLVWARHFLEHLTFEENVFLFNEVYRILKVGGLFEILVPHGMSYSSMSDLSHKTFWTEDSFGHFTPDNKFHYEWGVVNQWKIVKNDQTPPYEYTTKGWVELKAREIHATLQKLPPHKDEADHNTANP
jgi:predicted SAM-dependent methyltransferase